MGSMYMNPFWFLSVVKLSDNIILIPRLQWDLPAYLLLYLSIHLSIYLSVSINLSNYSYSVCLSIYPSIQILNITVILETLKLHYNTKHRWNVLAHKKAQLISIQNMGCAINGLVIFWMSINTFNYILVSVSLSICLV